MCGLKQILVTALCYTLPPLPLPPSTQAEVEAARAALQDTRLALNDAEAPGGSASERQRLRAQLAQQAEAIDTASVQVGRGLQAGD